MLAEIRANPLLMQDYGDGTNREFPPRMEMIITIHLGFLNIK